MREQTVPPELNIRQPVPSDIKLVMDAWIKGFRNSPYAGCVTNDRWHETQANTIEQLLARGAKLEVLCSVAKPDQIVGFVCWESVKGGLCVHYLYIKDPFRRTGLGSALLNHVEAQHGTQEGSPVRRFYTHRTDASRYFRGWSHCPDIARRR